MGWVINMFDTFLAWSSTVTYQIKDLSPLSQNLWPPNIQGSKIKVMGYRRPVILPLVYEITWQMRNSDTLRGETFAGRKCRYCCKFWTILLEFDSRKNIFVKIRESLSHAKWTSKASLMKIEKDLLEYA